MIRFVRSLPGDFRLRREAADELGKSVGTLHALTRRFPGEGLGPSHTVPYGSMTLRLYSAERIEHIRAFLAARTTFHEDGRERRRGRRQVWTSAEARSRRQRTDQARYHRRHAQALRERGEDEKAAEAEAKAAVIMRELRAQECERRGELKPPPCHCRPNDLDRYLD